MGTRLVKELTEFNGDLCLEGLIFWKTAFSAMTLPAATITSSPQAQGPEASEAGTGQTEADRSSATGKKVVLVPCRSPPSRERVQLWLEAKKQYELLLKGRRDTGMLEKGGVEVDESPDRHDTAASSPPAVEADLCKRLSSIRAHRRKKHNLSLIISPMNNAGSHCKSTELSPISDEDSVDFEQEDRKNGDDKTRSPESPELPSWQQPCRSDQLRQDQQSENSPEPPSPRLSNSPERLGENTSPTLLRDEERTSPHLLHTPFLSRRQRSKEDRVPVCSTPISEGKNPSSYLSTRSYLSTVSPCCFSFYLFMRLFFSPLLWFISAADDPVSQRLQQRRRSQAEPLRRVLLTTQMKVRPHIHLFILVITPVTAGL